jgi:hypothetical protein
MRAAHIADVRHGLAAELRRSRHPPSRHDKLAFAIRCSADDRRELIGEDTREQGQVACVVMPRSKPIADRGLAFGEAVKTTHRSSITFESGPSQQRVCAGRNDSAPTERIVAQSSCVAGFRVTFMSRVAKRSAARPIKTSRPRTRQIASPLPGWIPPQLCQPVETAPLYQVSLIRTHGPNRAGRAT